MSKVIGYARVSTKGQLEGNSIEQQTNKIKSIYDNAEIYEESYSGKSITRPVMTKVINTLKTGDTLVVSSLDRFCRSTQEGLEQIDKLTKLGVKIHILNIGLIEDTPLGKMLVTNLLAFAEFERAMIIERTQTGKAIAKKKEGYKEGRPRSYSDEQLSNALSMLTVNGGAHSYNDVARILKISKSTLIRANKNYKAN